MSTQKLQIAIMIDLDWSYRHHLEVFWGTQQFAQRHSGWEVIIDPHADGTLPARGKESPYHGIIARATRQLERRAGRLGVPVVNVWLNSPATSLPSVFPDVASTGRMAAEHLLSRGLRQFRYLGFAREQAIRPQLQAFREAVAAAGCGCSPLLVKRTYASNAKNWAAFREQLHTWLDTWEQPCGVLCSFDLLARYLAHACARRGLRVPEDVAIVGTRDESLICLHPDPSLSSIDLGYERVGMRAAQLLDELLNGAAPPTGPIYVPPRGLFARRSTDVYAVDDPIVAVALQFIAENCSRPLKVDDVAQAVATTRRTLERRFRDVLDCSVNEELNRLRLERAKRRLMESKLSIKAIAIETGFGSATQMGLVFQRFEGYSPSEFRRRHAPHGE